MKCVYILALFLAAVQGSDEDIRIIDSITQETPCREAGGQCVVAADCPEGSLTTERGLCPQQQDQGIECCYEMSVKETRCNKRGGVCIPKNRVCNIFLLYSEATDCPETEQCCLWDI